MPKDKKEKLVHTLKEAGVAKWAYLKDPDDFEGKKRYKMDVVYPAIGKYQQKLIDRIDQLAAQELERAKVGAKTAAAKKKCKASDDVPYGMVLDDDDNETGEVWFRFKRNAEYKHKKSGKMKRMRPPVLFDARGNLITDDGIAVGNGSLVKVRFEFYPYSIKNSGVSLRMEAVQIIKLVEFGGGSADAEDYGFNEEEGDDLSERSFGGDDSGDLDGEDGESTESEDEDEDAGLDDF